MITTDLYLSRAVWHINKADCNLVLNSLTQYILYNKRQAVEPGLDFHSSLSVSGLSVSVATSSYSIQKSLIAVLNYFQNSKLLKNQLCMILKDSDNTSICNITEIVIDNNPASEFLTIDNLSFNK